MSYLLYIHCACLHLFKQFSKEILNHSKYFLVKNDNTFGISKVHTYSVSAYEILISKFTKKNTYELCFASMNVFSLFKLIISNQPWRLFGEKMNANNGYL